MEGLAKEIRIFRRKNGSRPFAEWLDGLRDQRAIQKIQVRIDRLSLGNPGKTRGVGGGVQELKVDYGPGYRVYFGIDGNTIVILLLGGDKRSQDEDIRKAREYWKEYKTERWNAN